MTQLIEVDFGGNRKEFFQWDGEPLKVKTGVIVEVDRGEDFGRVHATGDHAEKRCRGCVHGCGNDTPDRMILRVASEDEVSVAAELRKENESARRTAIERVKAHDLVMKVTDAEWQWDKRKLTFYFTAERRVDFRALVRDLATIFRTRIELRQIGVRDEARRLGGVGRCGREYCSASWLRELRPVSLGIASDQRLSLNPQQISGACGRLMCCLRYEHDFYLQSRRRFPKEGRALRTSAGEERVVSCNIFRDTVMLINSDGDTRTVALALLKAEVAAAANGAEVHFAIDNPADDGGNGNGSGNGSGGVGDSGVDGSGADAVTPDVGFSIDADLADDSKDHNDNDAEPVSTGEPLAGTEEVKRKRRRGRRGGRRFRNKDNPDNN